MVLLTLPDHLRLPEQRIQVAVEAAVLIQIQILLGQERMVVLV
jgi:hypothetical protein